VNRQFPWEPFPDPEDPDPKGPDQLHGVAYRAAVTESDAYRSVRLALRRESGTLRVGNRFVPDGRYREVAFVAAGNASNSMALAALHAIGERLTQGFLAGPEAIPDELPFRGVSVPAGLPGAREAEEVVEAALEIARDLSEQDLLLVLLSPGALRALATPPAGSTPGEFAQLLARAELGGATGREIGLLTRVLGTGAVGGRLAAATTHADVATLLVDRGDGATVLGGGPMRAIEPTERDEARQVARRCGVENEVPVGAWEPTVAPIPASRTGLTFRPVVVASPADALRAAADAVFDKGWTSRLAFLEVREFAEAAARRCLDRSEELYVAERITVESRTKGVATFAMTTLGLPEGVDEGPALATFLTAAQSLLRRRETSVGVFRTAGDIGSREYPPGAVVGTPVDAAAKVAPGLARGLRMGRGITDVGDLVMIAYPKPGAPT
jgi:glycerate-2-kinase